MERNGILIREWLKWGRTMVSVVWAFALAWRATAGVVVNEIFDHAPHDLSDLEFVELHNPTTESVSPGAWRLSGEIEIEFPANARLEPGGFLVLCADRELFDRLYPGVEVFGEFRKSLGKGGDEVWLLNAAGQLVDAVEYQDRAPWPVSPDGRSASLERVCPARSGEDASNWGASALSENDWEIPAGTPGRQNSIFSQQAPPIVEEVWSIPENTVAPSREVPVRARTRGAKTVELLYRSIPPGRPGRETTISMVSVANDVYSAAPASQEEGRLLRFRKGFAQEASRGTATFRLGGIGENAMKESVVGFDCIG